MKKQKEAPTDVPIIDPEFYDLNPRVITHNQLTSLQKWLDELGDLSGVVHDLNSNQLVGGNQRGRVFNIVECEIEFTLQTEEPDRQGTVGIGYIIWHGERYSYRQVRWDSDQFMRANIIANKAGGTWDWDILANTWDESTLLRSGFEKWEIGANADVFQEPSPPDEFPEYDDKITTEYCCPKCSYEWSGKPK